MKRWSCGRGSCPESNGRFGRCCCCSGRVCDRWYRFFTVSLSAKVNTDSTTNDDKKHYYKTNNIALLFLFLFSLVLLISVFTVIVGCQFFSQLVLVFLHLFAKTFIFFSHFSPETFILFGHGFLYGFFFSIFIHHNSFNFNGTVIVNVRRIGSYIRVFLSVNTTFTIAFVQSQSSLSQFAFSRIPTNSCRTGSGSHSRSTPT
mmetsp:Transcript_15516/g.38225  ORF Transcript_15516/g.38225 Transcript_15516/m.38225 type:complete len:202 (-) Transcript_15516:412-1017(-)